MKPIYTVLLKRGEREHLLSFPITPGAADKAETGLGYEPDFDVRNDDGYIAEYRSRIGAAPDTDALFDEVNSVAVCLSKFTPAQKNSLKSLCRSFALDFENVSQFLSYLCLAKRTSREIIAENGVPLSVANHNIFHGGR